MGVVYKSLSLLDYLLRYGSSNVVDDARERIYQIRSLQEFRHVDPDGQDRGMNVRQLSKQVVNLLNNSKQLKEIRKEAQRNKDKFVAISSSGTANGSSYNGYSNSSYSNSSSFESYKPKKKNENSWDNDDPFGESNNNKKKKRKKKKKK